jgi:redox-sensitive bicupin YhaK (pirin superfamily)
MHEGDLAQLTEGETGMLHKEWNQAPGVRTHIFILVYRPDTEPPPVTAAFSALRADDRPTYEEVGGARTIELVGGRSHFRPNLNRLRFFGDTSLDSGTSVEIQMEPNEGLVVYPLEGRIVLDNGGRSTQLAASGSTWPEGPDAMALAWSAEAPRSFDLKAANGPARFVRLAFQRADDDLILHQPYRRRV